MVKLSTRSAYLTASGVGVVLWLAASAAGGRREAWDSPFYWTLAYPIGIVLAGAIGFLAPERPWRWGLALMLAQAVTLAVMSNSFGLLPLGLVLFGVLAIPPMLAASGGAWLRARVGPGD
jgi:hypothetical protein